MFHELLGVVFGILEGLDHVEEGADGTCSTESGGAMNQDGVELMLILRQDVTIVEHLLHDDIGRFEVLSIGEGLLILPTLVMEMLDNQCVFLIISFWHLKRSIDTEHY